jgi:hypothetical protein
MLDIYEKDYIKDVKQLDEETKQGDGKKKQTTSLVKGFMDDIKRLQNTKEKTDDPIKKANIDKQIATIKIKMAQTRNRE